jgi:hypothetical protein
MAVCGASGRCRAEDLGQPGGKGCRVTQGTTRLLRVKVHEFRCISAAKRLMLGLIAGNACMGIDVECVQLQPMQALGSKTIHTTPSAWEGIFSGATPKQVQAVARIVVQYAQGGSVAQWPGPPTVPGAGWWPGPAARSLRTIRPSLCRR